MQPNQIILYVNNIPETVLLYTKLLNCQPQEQHINYASFQLESGYILAFWNIKAVEPNACGINQALELVFPLPSRHAVELCFAEWGKLLTILQLPQDMDFGYTFTALDNNQNRLRVYVSNE